MPWLPGQVHACALGGSRLYRNRGDGTFEDVTEKAGVRGAGYGMACAAGDFDADGWTDLYVCSHGASELYRNRGDGTFEAAGARLGAAVKGCSVGAVFADLDGDRWPDVYVARYVEIGPGSRQLCRMNDVATSCGPQQYAPEAGVFLRNQNRRPVAAFSASATAQGIVLNGSASSDPEGEPLTYVWYDGTTKIGEGITFTYPVAAGSSHTIQLKVYDPAVLEGVAAPQVVIG